MDIKKLNIEAIFSFPLRFDRDVKIQTLSTGRLVVRIGDVIIRLFANHHQLKK